MCLGGYENMESLDCPSCNEKIEVTWKQYWRSGLGYYHCPHCKDKSKFQTKPRWVQFSSWALQFFALMACYASFTTFGFLGSVSLLILIPVFLFDKHLDTKFGNLVTAHNKQG